MRNHTITPVLTEKATRLSEKGTYLFTVHQKATKHQVAQSIEQLFNVEVDTVRTMNRKGKVRRVGRKQATKPMPDKKLVFVTLKKGTLSVMPQA